MDKLEETRITLQETMNLLGALAAGVEHVLGPPSMATAYLAGKRLGRRIAEDAPKESEMMPALETLRKTLEEQQVVWRFEPFKMSNQSDIIERNAEGDGVVRLVFRDCMIRQSLFRYGHPQQGALCQLTHGFLAGALETIMDRKATLEILHSGENACLKCLTVEDLYGGEA